MRVIIIEDAGIKIIRKYEKKMPINSLTQMTWTWSLKDTNDQNWHKNETYLDGLVFDKTLNS